MAPQQDEMIVKANRLVEAKMPMSKIGHRIVGLLISQLGPDTEDFGFQKLYVKEIKDQAGTKGRDIYSRAKGVCDQLMETQLKIKKQHPDGKREYRSINLMDECRYREGHGYIEAKFNESMKPFLLRLQRRFTMYKTRNFVPLSSTYSMRIYELLKMRQDISILRITIGELREILSVTDSYEYFSHLEHHVIKKAQKEVAEKTDIYFTYDVERKGRTAKRLKFFIHLSDEESSIDASSQAKMEDRTQAPNIDAIDLFLHDLTQEEIDETDKGKLRELYEKMAAKARRENPDASSTVIQSFALQEMKSAWDQRSIQR